MHEIKFFSILTIIFLLIGFLLIGIGRGKELTDKEFEKQYKETLIGEIDIPTITIVRINKELRSNPIFEDLPDSYLMADIHEDGYFKLFFGYTEHPTSILTIDKILIQNKMEIDFIQDDDAFKDKTKERSFVVFSIDAKITNKYRNPVVTIYFKKNKLNITEKMFVLYRSQLEEIDNEVKEWYIEYLKNPKQRI